MTRGRLIFFFLSFAIVFPLVSGGLRGEGGQKDQGLYRNLSVFTEVLSLVRRAYVEEVEVDQLMNGALDGTADALDAFSLFVPASHVPDFLEARQVGISHSGVLMGKARGVAFVLALDPAGPGAAAGLEAGDVISLIDGRSTRDMALYEIEVLLAGEAGTTLDLEIIRVGETLTKELNLASYDKALPELVDHDGVGRLSIPSFDDDTTRLVASLLDGYEGDSLLLDLRRSALGEARHAYDVARLFTKGELGLLVSRGEELETFQAMAEPLWTGDLVVLVDRATLGPGELLATILQQAVGATLVGQNTFGYAGRQALFSLSDGARLQLTDAFYAGPDHEPLVESLEPDVAVTGRHRGLPTGDEETSFDELILEEGLRVLREGPPADVEEEREAA